MREKTTNGQVIIVYTEHPVFGILLIPYIAERLEDGTLQLIEQAFHASPEAIEQMNEAERQAIDIASHYTEKYLMGAYSREKIVSRFLHKLSQDPEKVKNNIRPFIEGKLLEMLTLIRENGLSFYQKQPGSKVLYAHHAYHVHPHDAEVRFTFHVDSSTFRYQLQCYYEKQPFSLDDQKPVIALTASPATLLLGMNLYFFPHIDSVRLLPFTKKKAISASAAQLEKYIDNIVIPIARYHEIITEGWDIPEERCACEALLSLEDITHSEQLLQLGFRYRDQLFTSDNGAAMKKIIYRKDSGEVSFFRRDIVAEKKAIQLLESSGLQRIGDIHFRLSASSSEKTLVEWINKHREMLQSDFQLTGHMGNTPYCLDEIHIEQSCDDEVVDWFELHITVVVGNLRIPFSRFRKHILEEKREYLLPDGRMILLPEEWFSKYANLLEMGVQTEQGIRLKHTFIGAAQAALGGTGLKKFSGKNQIKNVSVPKALKATLRPYQQKGFSWMMHLHKLGFGGCLADDMGLGKTIQIITLLKDAYGTGERQPSLIICPASLVYNWEHEIGRFAPDLRVLSIVGNGPEREARLESVREQLSGGTGDGCQVLVTSYDLLKRDIRFYEDIHFRYQVIDEAQYIKNAATQSAKAVKAIDVRTRFALTGTPVENRLSEIWSIFDYLMPGFLFASQYFKKEFENPIVRDGDEDALIRLRRIIGPFVLKRVKKDVLKELPDKLEQVVYSNFEGEQKKLYAANAVKLKEKLESGGFAETGDGRLQILAELMRLRQLCCDPRLCYENYKSESAKLETCMDLVRRGISGEHKILLFSQFTSMLELIERRLIKEGVASHKLTGATSKEERIRMVGEFQRDDVPVFLISLKAGGTGLNLTAADIVIHYDPWWNVAAQNQATDRTHRIGQKKQVTVYKLITRNTIEENILKLQESKQYLADQIVTEGTVSFGSLTKEDILNIVTQEVEE